MEATTRRYAAIAGALGAMLWLIAHVGITFGEIEYLDPTRPNPMPDWVVSVCLVSGAILIALFATFSSTVRGARRVGAGRVLILLGAAISLVPVWPFIFLGPLLVAVGFFILGVAAWTAGRRSVGIALHAFGLPLALPSGIAFDALGTEGAYGGLAFAAVFAVGVVLRSFEPAAAEEPGAPVATGAAA